jgi:NADH-quinone oxidoreductase subunit I
MFGKGLLTGLGITIKHFGKHFTGGAITQMYPEDMPKLPPRSHGSFVLEVPKCIACGLCVNACPNKVIKVDAVKDENNKRKLTGYTMFIERCLFCGLCVEACPTSGLVFSSDFEHGVYTRAECTWDMMARYYRSNPLPQEAGAGQTAEE